MKNIVISSIEQYGYLIDTYKYCEKLKKNNKITYVCFDYGFEKIEDELVDVIYLPKEGSLIKRMVNLNRTVAKVAKRNKCDLIFNVYTLADVAPASINTDFISFLAAPAKSALGLFGYIVTPSGNLTP